MRVGFLLNQIDNRGTGNATFDYAKYNRDLLGNQSIIYTPVAANHNLITYDKFYREFGPIKFVSLGNISSITDVDVLYHITYGEDVGIRTNSNVRYAVHSVFANQPHGNRYATVSNWLRGDTGTPFVPHIVDLPKDNFESIRGLYKIPETSVVFGRYGAVDTFDISWVRDAIQKILDKYDNIWFIFANTDTERLPQHPRVIQFNELNLPEEKATFILSTDYMLHARNRGETFGTSVGEFGIKGKPIITYGESQERAHIEEIGNKGFIYKDQFDLYDILSKLSLSKKLIRYTYTQYTPKNVMKKFKEVFLD